MLSKVFLVIFKVGRLSMDLATSLSISVMANVVSVLYFGKAVAISLISQLIC